MERSTILYKRAVYVAQRDGLPINLREDIVSSMLHEAEKVKGIDQSEAHLYMRVRANGYLYGNVYVGT